MKELDEFISLTDFYHLVVFRAMHANCKNDYFQKIWLMQVIKKYSSLK